MKRLICKSLLLGMLISLSAVPMVGEAYRCAWHHGQRVCWHTGVQHCRWVGGHWYHGVYFKGHNDCWVTR